MGTSSTTGSGRFVRFGDVQWQRRTEDDWPPLVKRLWYDEVRGIFVNIVWYARGVVEPRHVHDGTHATWVLVGAATMDGQTIGPGDVVYGPGKVPHGPLTYEMGCMLFSTIYGGALHSVHEGQASDRGPTGVPAQLVDQAIKANSAGWQRIASTGGRSLLMVDDPPRSYSATVLVIPAGSSTTPHQHEGSHASLIMSGTAVVGGEVLYPWDLICCTEDHSQGFVQYPETCTILMSGIGDISTEGVG